MLATISLIFYTDLILFFRRSHEWLYPLGFFIIVISLFPLALSPDPVFLQKFIPGCIWIAALLASFLAIENVFSSDLEDGNLEQMLLSQLPFSLSVFAKLAAHWLVTQFPIVLL